MKLSIPKEVLQQLIVLDIDAGFNERALKRITAEVGARQMVLLQRNSALNRKVINMDLEKGFIELGDIIEVAKK